MSSIRSLVAYGVFGALLSNAGIAVMDHPWQFFSLMFGAVVIDIISDLDARKNMRETYKLPGG